MRIRALLILVATLNGAHGFERVGRAHAVDVYRDLQSPVISLMAEGDIDALPSVVRAILLDYSNAGVLSSQVAESRVLSTGTGEVLVYQRLKLPVVADRDFTLRARWGEERGTLWVRFAVDNSRGPGALKGIVRVSTLVGGWDLRPTVDGHGTHAIYRVDLDLAGSLPRWMVSGGAAKNLPSLFEAIRRQAQRP